MSLVASLLVPLVGLAPAAADQSGPDQARLSALTAKVTTDAGHIHQLTEQLDQARLQVDTTSARLIGVTRQHDVTLQDIGANRAVLLDQAVRAYMNGGQTASMSSAPASTDMTLGREYLRVASGDLADTGDQLRQLEATLRADQAMLRGAQKANLQATAQLQVLRTNALSVAASEQAQLDSLQSQLAAQAQAQATAATRTVAVRPTTQGLPVNNGLVSLVQQAAGLPVAAPVVAAAPPAAAPPAAASGSGGGHAGGVWLSLRKCESGDNYAENTGNGYFGAYQFSASTWTGLGFPGRPDLESPAMQDDAAMKLQAQSGWGQWPACSAALGLT